MADIYDDDDEEELDDEEDLDDEEESSEDEGGEENVGGNNSSNNKSDDDNDNTVDEQNLNSFQKKIFERREKILKNKLTKISTAVQGGKSKLNFLERRTIKEAKQHKKLKPDISKIEITLKANKIKRTTKIVQSLSVPMFWVLIGVLIFLAVIFILAVIVIILGSIGIKPFRQWIEDIVGPGKFDEMMQETSMGIKGDKFYGTRAIYKDEEKAQIQILTDYVDFVKDGVTVATNFEEGYTIGEAEETKTYEIKNVSVDINLEIDFTDFDETEFKTNNLSLYEFLMNISGEIFELDNGGSAPETLVERVAGIKYFGVDEATLSHIIPEVISLVENNIDFEIYLEDTKQEDQTLFETLKPLLLDNVDQLIEARLNDPVNTVRTEKLFIKDVLFKDDDNSKTDGNLGKANYIALMFMPKKDVTFTYFSFILTDNSEDVEMTLLNGETDLGLKYDGLFMSKDDNKSDEGDGVDVYYYCTKELHTSASKFTNIDEENKTVLKGGLSFIGLVKSEADFEKYLELTNVEGQDIYTFKIGGITLNLNSSDAFVVKEYETKYE